MTSRELIDDIWSRRHEPFSVRMTVRQVNFFIDLLRRERIAPPTRQHCYPLYGGTVPLEVVVYPNGAGFVRVQQWAITPDQSCDAKWRLKTDAELRADRTSVSPS